MVLVPVTYEVLVHLVRHERIQRYGGPNLAAEVRDGLLALSWADDCTGRCSKDIDSHSTVILKNQASVIEYCIENKVTDSIIVMCMNASFCYNSHGGANVFVYQIRGNRSNFQIHEWKLLRQYAGMHRIGCFSGGVHCVVG